MNIAVIIGAVLCIVLMIFGIVFVEGVGIVFSNFGRFLNVPSLLITVGGTLAVLIMSFPIKDSITAVTKTLPIIMGLKKQKNDPLYYINVMTELSTEARKKGLLALEDQVAQFEDPFLRDSVMLIVDAMEPDKVREQLDNELNNIEARHQTIWDFFDKGAALAPGFGMIGTLIGLVNMLFNMDFNEADGAQKLAKDMGVALITTFYGSLMANAIFIPLGNQLRVAHNEEMLCKEIIIEGIISIQAGENPRHINEKLMAFLTRKQREQASVEAGGGSSDE